MVCQICGKKSGFFPLCKECNYLKDEGKITKCEECGIWKNQNKPLCLDCYQKKQNESRKKNLGYVQTDEEKEDNDFRNKFQATINADDGHRVRSKAEQLIDNWLYRQGIVHAYERKVPIEEDVYCDFFIPEGRVWIEFWGKDEENYKKRMILKKSIYNKYGLNLIELNDKDLEKIDDVMPTKLRKFFPKEFIFE